MKSKIIKILELETFSFSDENGNTEVVVSRDDFESIAEKIDKLYNSKKYNSIVMDKLSQSPEVDLVKNADYKLKESLWEEYQVERISKDNGREGVINKWRYIGIVYGNNLFENLGNSNVQWNFLPSSIDSI